jgi:ABC-2 type transport system permease protein
MARVKLEMRGILSIVKWTLWQRRWSTFWWILGIFGFIFLNIIFYPTFKDQAAELQKSFESLPEAAVQLFGGSTDFFSPIGFLNSQIFFLMLPMLLSILAIGMGTSLIGREEQDGTLETLLARPISRSRLLLAKAKAGGVILVIVSMASLLTTVGLAQTVGLTEVSALHMTEATFACFMLALSFGAIAFLLTTIGRARGASLGITAFVALGGYLISSLAGTVSWLKTPSMFFPFHYYRSEEILRGTLHWSDIMVFVVIITVCGFISWISFRRRDIA